MLLKVVKINKPIINVEILTKDPHKIKKKGEEPVVTIEEVRKKNPKKRSL